MSQLHEVLKPIINSPFEEPTRHYVINPGEPAQLMEGRREAFYYYRPPERQTGRAPSDEAGTKEMLPLVNTLRERVKAWRALARRGEGGVTRTTMELLNYWRREERWQRLFFCQLEAAETIQSAPQGRDTTAQSSSRSHRARGSTFGDSLPSRGAIQLRN